MKTVAIIPTGGSGRRLQSGRAKQYLEIGGLPVLLRTLQVFQQAKDVDEIVLVVPEKDIDFVRDEFIGKYQLTKVSLITAGGRERQDSVLNGLKTISGNCDIVIIHDGVRPFVNEKMINEVIAAARSEHAAAIGVMAKDTVKEAGADGFVVRTKPRQNIWQAQTPQAFAFKILKKAYDVAGRDNYLGTDDASLVERIGIKVKMIEGEYSNIKITTQEDLIMADALLKNKSGNEVCLMSGLGYDSHRFVEGRKLVLGGVEIPFALGLHGHSDADALIHALCDALLGAAAAGDIGRHFPDSDPAYKNISSMIILTRVAEIIANKGFSINNIDITVIMEKPRLAPYAAQIVSNLAGALNIPGDHINIKAKTNEGMGFTGHGEGVAVFATATITRRGPGNDR